MEQNISFEGGGFQVSEQLIARAVKTIFPGSNHLDTIILLFSWFLIGIVTLGIFFYFSKKRRMFKTMSKLEKGIFSLLFGFGAFMTVIITYLPFALLGFDPLNFFGADARMLPFMILACFLLYGCLVVSSAKMKGRPFLIGTYRILEAFFILISASIMSVALTIKTKDYFLLSWFLVVLIYLNQRFVPFLKR